MVFYQDDYYFGGGSAPLRNRWTENVTKFDTSSFYNWEQDNEPVYDLEERTYSNWEQLGFYGSSVPGMTLTVSADANVDVDGDGVADPNSRLFLDLSSAVEALPRVINFPTFIEVGSFGDLGGVSIHGLQFGDSGSLEIINRNFAKGYSASTTVSSLVTNDPDLDDFGLIRTVSSNEVSSTFSQASCVDISATVFSSINDVRTVGNMRSVAQFPGHRESSGTDSAGYVGSTRLAVSIEEDAAFSWESTHDYGIVLDPYEMGGLAATDSSGGDMEVISQMTGARFIRSRLNNLILDTELLGQTAGESTYVNALIYGNHLQSISVENCNGPVYLRNFFVDGENSRDTGVSVKSCSNVLLENMTSVRCTKEGFLVQDSEVRATRGMVAYRCYGFATGTQRLSQPWTDHAVSSIAPVGLDDAAGLRLIRSTLDVSSDISREAGGDSVGADMLFTFSRNANGIVLENSVLKGGLKRTGAGAETMSHIGVEHSVERSILANNSTIDLNGKLSISQGAWGIELNDSTFKIDESEINMIQKTGLWAKNSNIIYNKNKHQPATYQDKVIAGVFGSTYTQNYFAMCGQAIVLNNSNMDIPHDVSAIENNYGRMTFELMHGNNQGNNDMGVSNITVALPIIQLDNNSYARILHSKMYTERTDITANSVDHHYDATTWASKSDTQPVYGSCLSVLNGSSAKMQGSEHAATILQGPNRWSKQKRMAGVYVGRNSSVEFNGPTAMIQYGVNALAEDNSVITFGPHRDRASNGIDVSGFAYSNPKNHTSVELHSTKACLVVNRGSTLNIKDVGEHSQYWNIVEGDTNGNTAITNVPTYDSSGDLDLVGATSAASFQFYPNPNDVEDYSDTRDIIVGLEGGVDNLATIPGAHSFSQTGDRFNYWLSSAPWDLTKQNSLTDITNGGVCVRALGDSTVNAINSNFQCGWWNPSGVVYDSSGSLCDKTFIWNIADNSKLNAAYVSVSSMHPEDVGYHGPSGVWLSSVDSNGSSVTFQAPDSTADTSSLSILDVFGDADGEIVPREDGAWLPLGPGSFENRGPFRLYFSVDSMANFLTNPNSTPDDIYGAPYQIFSQGYAASATLSASPTVSSLYDQINNISGTTTVAAGNHAYTQEQFFYPSSMVVGNPQVTLDRSAANMFANAKHCASSKSGRRKLVNIHESHQGVGGEGMLNTNKNLGRGFKSSNVFDLGREE